MKFLLQWPFFMRKLILFFLLALLFSCAKKPFSEITWSDLQKWDQIANEVALKNNIINGDRFRLFAYLYVAQRAFVEKSQKVGNIDAISAHVLHLFAPEYEPEKDADPFSDEITASIAKQIDERFYYEQQGIHPVSINFFPGSWQGKEPYFGIYAPSLLPWFLHSASEFLPARPPSPEDHFFWDHQLDLVKKTMAGTKSKKTILYWDHKADWKKIADDYMEKQNVPLSKRLKIRAILACALCDCYIALWDAKYTYLVRRPYQLDPELKTVVPDPNHPSFPCGHCGLSATAATILSAFFPENQSSWQQMARESSLSRIQSGLHFPIDADAAENLGKEVGRASLERSLSL